MVALLQLRLEFLVETFGSFEVIVKAVEVIHQLLVVVHRDVRLHLLDACDLLLVACELLLDLLDYPFVVGNLLLRVSRLFGLELR